MAAIGSEEREAIAELEEAGRTFLGYTRPRVLQSSGTYGLSDSHHVEVALVDLEAKEITSVGGDAGRVRYATAILVLNVDGGKDAGHRLDMIRGLTEAIKRKARNEAR